MALDGPPPLGEFPPGRTCVPVNVSAPEVHGPPFDGDRSIRADDVHLQAFQGRGAGILSVWEFTSNRAVGGVSTKNYVAVDHVDQKGRFPERSHVSVDVMGAPSLVLLCDLTGNLLYCGAVVR